MAEEIKHFNLLIQLRGSRFNRVLYRVHLNLAVKAK